MKKKSYLLAGIALLITQILPVATVHADPSQPATATVNYTYDGNGAADIFINGVMLDQGEPDPHAPTSGVYNGSIDYDSDGTGFVNITLATFATMSTITAVNINGTNYPVPTDQATVLGLINGQVIEYNLGNISKADTYNIATTTARSTLMGNFSWSYKDADKDRDNYIDNGVVSLVELEYNGTKYTSRDEIVAAGLPYLQYNVSDAGAYNEFTLPTGTKVTLKLMPNAGHQLTSFTVNGGEFEPQEEIGVYTFESESGNFHLGAHFTAVGNTVEASNADSITSGSITLSNGELNNGTARLEVKNAEGLEPVDIENFEKNSKGYNLKTILDISLFNTIYKGSKNDSWDTQLDELDHEATITLQLDEGVDGNDIIIIHEKHDGTYEVIPTTYDAASHTITFKTFSFSNYAIATRTIAAPDTGAATAEGASATENIDPIIGILGALSLWVLLGFTIKKGLV